MSNVELRRLVRIVDPDLFKRGHNDLWTEEVEHLVNKYFGPLVETEEPDLLKANYIVDFEDHSDELVALPHISGILSKKHSQCIREIVHWLKETSFAQRRSISRYVNQMPAISRILTDDESRGRLLCGRRGSGKTSLIKYNIVHLERENNCLCLYIPLDVKAFPGSTAVQYMMTSIINQLDDLTLQIAQQNNIDFQEVVLHRFEKLWLLNAALPKGDRDDRKDLREKLLLQLHVSKHHRDFENYVLWSVSYLEKISNRRLIIILDDIDHLSSDEEAFEICDFACSLYRRLKRSMIIAVREETLAKLSDKTLPAVSFPKKHIIPPSFRKVLNIRLENLKKELSERHPTGCGKYTVNGICLFLDHIVESICVPTTYAKLVTFHYDIDLLLDIARCLIGSPYMVPADIFNKARCNKKIGWNLMLNSLQKYIYLNHYDQNSFFLNMYDNTSECITDLENLAWRATYQDTFVRIALLRVLAHHLSQVSGQPPDQRILEVALIEQEMVEALGYNEEKVWSALRAFARHRLVRTGQQQTQFDKKGTRKVSISTAVLYYLDCLISEYRYVENALPVTPIDFEFDPRLLPTEVETYDLEHVDDLILKFADFVERCEEDEKQRLKDEKYFNALMEGEMLLSERLRRSVKEFKRERLLGTL